MPKRISFTPEKDPRRGWRINVPAVLTQTGKRERRFFRTRELAQAHAATLKKALAEHGANTQSIRPSLAEAATAAEKLLEPLGVGLLDAVRAYVEIEKARRASVTVAAACAEFQSTAGDWSASQTTAYRLRCGHLERAFGSRLISTVGPGELAENLRATTGGPGAYNQAVRLVRTIWRWCAKPPRGWCNTETVNGLEMAATEHQEVGVLTAAEARSILDAAERYFPETVPAFAVALFTGLRQAELERLRAEHFTDEGIVIPGKLAKTGRRRFIEMPDPLRDWLAAYPVGATLCPPNWDRKDKAVRRLAGFRIWSDTVGRLPISPPLTPEPPPDLPAWPSNALRHTAASVAVSLGKPLESLLFEHGHSGGVALLKRHYLGLMTKSEALKIWAIRPHGATAEDTLKVV